MAEQNEQASQIYVVDNTLSLKELISTIVDYYCFKNDCDNDSFTEDSEDDLWKIKGEMQEESVGKSIIPADIDDLIKKSFTTQLSKYIEVKP